MVGRHGRRVEVILLNRYDGRAAAGGYARPVASEVKMPIQKPQPAEDVMTANRRTVAIGCPCATAQP